MTLNNRKSYIDIAKGILIICLCFHHFPQALKQLNIFGGGDFSFIWLTYKFYACYFMQAFFIISGLCSNFEKDLKSFFYGNLKGLVIPAICFDIIIRIISYIAWGKFSGNGFWFLYTLFACKMLYWGINKINIRQGWKDAGLFLISLLMIRIAAFCKGHNLEDFNLLYYQNVLAMFFFLHIGVFLKRFTSHHDRIFLFGTLVFILLLGSHLIYGLTMPFVGAGIGSLDRIYIPHYIMFSLSGSFCILYVSKMINTCRIFEKIGRVSLLIYGFHFIVLKLVTDVIYYVFHPELTQINTFFLASCSITTALTSLLSLLIVRVKSLSILTGKW